MLQIQNLFYNFIQGAYYLFIILGKLLNHIDSQQLINAPDYMSSLGSFGAVRKQSNHVMD